MTKIDKEKLTEEMNSKNREWLIESDGVSALFIHNLENFAYRYLETSTDKGIKCVVDGELYQVKSTEPSIIEALKWDNPELKKSLIDLCKKYPGKASKELRVNLSLETKMLGEHKNECYAHITCLLPNGENLILFEKTTSMSFDDPIELRNKHAALLEEVSVIF
ncbi:MULTISPECIES: hypothetical protein [unclassified Halobacteriovorax]|uniref:hypothetical protein n=1 Tax=unclassified Halobacteriovorax TaxID=2639665 RepID=UPI00399BB075